jgi:hypothetical protein
LLDQMCLKSNHPHKTLSNAKKVGNQAPAGPKACQTYTGPWI